MTYGPVGNSVESSRQELSEAAEVDATGSPVRPGKITVTVRCPYCRIEPDLRCLICDGKGEFQATREEVDREYGRRRKKTSKPNPARVLDGQKVAG